jgi:hypothetical protein
MVVPHQLGALIMKTLFGIAAVLAVTAISLATIDSAEARGPRGAGNVSMSNIQVGPRVTAPVIRPDRIAPQSRPPRQINGPRESGQGINCHYVRQATHLVATSRTIYRPHRVCPQRI